MVGNGAKLASVVTDAGIEMEVARLWSGTRALERQLKNRKNSPKLCPICLKAESWRRGRNPNRCSVANVEMPIMQSATHHRIAICGTVSVRLGEMVSLGNGSLDAHDTTHHDALMQFLL
jgi:hypothetical protein